MKNLSKGKWIAIIIVIVIVIVLLTNKPASATAKADEGGSNSVFGGQSAEMAKAKRRADSIAFLEREMANKK